MRYKKKPIVIEAFKWTGDIKQIEDPLWIINAIMHRKLWFRSEGTPHVEMAIETLEGTMFASRGDYIIKGIKGEIYPCKPDIFEQTYEAV